MQLLRKPGALALGAAVACLAAARPALAAEWDTRPDTWTGVDALGRRVPGDGEVPPPRRDRQVGIFYFLWLGEHGTRGPFDVTKILARDPKAMDKPDNPLWGPLYAPHHWGEPHFGYYLSNDEWVIRRHAQMLSDAGVDVIIFDVTNQLTYPRSYRAICRVYAQIRREGGRTPQIAFLAPFWDPGRVARALYDDLYEPGDYRDLWYRWEGKPLLMADPKLVTAESVGRAAREPIRLEAGATLGQTFRAERPLAFVGAPTPTWATKGAAVTVTLFDRPGGRVLKTKRYADVTDNAVLGLDFAPPLPPGTYYFEQSRPTGQVGWWSITGDVCPDGRAHAEGEPATGDRTLTLRYGGDREVVLAGEGARPDPAATATLARDIGAFFTFRKPQPDYFQGPTGPEQWGWLEVFPQHAFYKTPGVPEQMVVGVAQNAVDGRLSVLSNPRARGRSFHNGAQPPPAGRDFTGRNFAEQWERALKIDPRFVFVTGWNEWIAGRFPGPAGSPFYGSGPVSFVDQFDHEYSRDIEPVRGGHGDAYYYQLIANVRRYKGARAPEPAGPPRTVRIDGRFDDWAAVAPEYRDDRFDTTHRDAKGWGTSLRHTNRSGRNDFVRAKIARDARFLYAYAETRDPITSRTHGEWMHLYLNTDGDWATGWRGFDFAVNRNPRDDRRTSLEAFRGGFWRRVAEIGYRVQGRGLEIAIPRAALGKLSDPLRVDFKWTDNTGAIADALNLYSHGDTAPNGRFAFPYRAAGGGTVPKGTAQQ